MNHDFSPRIYYCKNCGKSYEEILNIDELRECSGDDRVFHPNFVNAQREFDKLFKPILEAVMKRIK